MTESACPFETRRDDVLVAYLYDELDAPARVAFESHLPRCRECREEVGALGAVRTHLASWTPPVFGRQSSVGSPQSTVNRRLKIGDWRLPLWAQAAAAMLVLGVSAGLANFNVHYDRSGLTIRTGWSRSVAPAPAPSASGATAPAPWRSDLAALERQLRTEFQPPQPPATPVRASASDAEVLRRVRALVDESERKQRRDLDLRVAEVLRDVENGRRADLVRINQSLGQLQSNTGVEVMKQRQLLNYLVRVSSQK